MEYLLIVSLVVAAPLALLIGYNLHLRKLAIQKILERNLLKKHPKSQWYSSCVVCQAAKTLNKLPKRKLQPLFAEIKDGKINKLAALLDKQTTNLLKSIYGRKGTFSPLQKAEQLLLNAETNSLSELVDNLSAANKIEQARIAYLQAGVALAEGDLLTASQQATTAAKIFQKHKLTYEEAQAYLLSGTIYRVSAVTDTADFMLRTAADLFGFIGANAKQAEAYGHLGMLMVMQERFDEAEQFFGQSKKLFELADDDIGVAEILNQQALTALIHEKYSLAEKLTKTALKVFGNYQENRGEALCYDIIAQIAAAQQQWGKVASYAGKARKLYENRHNLPAQQEMEFLLARAYLEKGDFSKSEQMLRQIIAQATQHKSCFHIANAYNLLGIIYLRQGDLRRAEGLFQQSLGAEMQNERWCGAAIDYANIALTSYRRGNKENGDKNRELAIKYAQDAGADVLAEMLKSGFNQ